jgi:CDP-6-deoxy-D-xylo-4-hexulose-3-dehydrase
MGKFAWPLMNNAISFVDKLKMIKFILSTNKFTNGPKVLKFENEWSKWLGCKHSLFVSSGSTANFLLIAAIKEKFNLKDGDKVLVPSCTWMTSVAPIFQNNLEPIFIDVSLENYCIDTNDLLLVKNNHPDIALIFTTHLLGFYSEVDKLKEAFPNALVAEDCCEAHGVMDKNKNKMSPNSLASTFSFYFGHHMTTIEGGFISTNDSELYDLMRMKRSHGLARESSKQSYEFYKSKHKDIIPTFLFVTDGFNFRNNEISAILGSEQLKRLDKYIKIRNSNYKQFHSYLNNFKDLFHMPLFDENMSSFTLPFVCKNKFIYQKLIEKFQKYNIEYRPLVAGNLLKQPFLKNYKFGYYKETYNADIIHDYGLYIGNSQFVNNNHLSLLKKILDEVRKDVKN